MGLNAATVRLLGNAFVQALRDSFADNATQWAAAIAYYSFLSLFPLLLAAVSLSAYFVSPDWAVGKAILLLGEFVPEGGLAVQRIIRGAIHDAHPYAGIVSLLILLVLGSRAFGALSRALNIAYEGEQTGSLARRIVIEIAMMAAVGVLFICTLFSHYVLLFLSTVVRLLPGETDATFAGVAHFMVVWLMVPRFYRVC